MRRGQTLDLADNLAHFPSGHANGFCYGVNLHSVAPYFASALAVWAPCFLKVRVSENSPKRWPTIFSVTNTGLKTLPLCTLKVRPTKSGVIIERRDQVLIGALDLVSFAFWIFSSR